MTSKSLPAPKPGRQKVQHSDSLVPIKSEAMVGGATMLYKSPGNSARESLISWTNADLRQADRPHSCSGWVGKISSSPPT